MIDALFSSERSTQQSHLLFYVFHTYIERASLWTSFTEANGTVDLLFSR